MNTTERVYLVLAVAEHLAFSIGFAVGVSGRPEYAAWLVAIGCYLRQGRTSRAAK